MASSVPAIGVQLARRRDWLFEVNSRSRVGAGRVTQNFGLLPSGAAEIEIIESDARSDSIDLR
jgi:hypothetical protein